MLTTQRIIDMHVHSDNSPDGQHSPMFICENAVDKGLGAVAFTDHCEVDQFFSNQYNSMVFHSYFECAKARSAFAGQLLVIIGIEIGQPLSDIALSERIIKQHPYDYVVASIHHPNGHLPDIKEIDYCKIDVYKFMSDYFEELIKLARWDGCDALAHITCPMRRIQGKYKIDFDYSKISDVTDELLDTIIKNEKTLEINTSGLRQDIGRTMPDKNIIKRYKELGGKYITIGSDSHSANDVGTGINEGLIIAKECGFDEVTFFVGREKMQVKIEI